MSETGECDDPLVLVTIETDRAGYLSTPLSPLPLACVEPFSLLCGD